MNKTEIKKLLVEERKKARLKQKNSAFVSKSRNVYVGQKKRALEDFKTTLSYSIEDFRAWLEPYIDEICKCGKKMTVNQIAVDHAFPVSRGGEWSIANLSAICRSCNYRKGKMLPDEFAKLEDFVEKNLSPESKADLWRRLVSGGKMTFGK